MQFLVEISGVKARTSAIRFPLCDILKTNTYKIMATIYKLKAKRDYGNMPKGYEFQVISNSFPTPNSEDIKEAIIKLGFNSQTLEYKSDGNWEIEKIGSTN